MKVFFFGVLFLVMTLTVEAQKFISVESVITFFSDAAIEDIQAENKKSSAILNVATGDVAFVVPIKQFQFPKKLMQQHFNEKYLESDKYPSSTFSGKLVGFDKNATGSQQVVANGKMNIHGVTKDVSIQGTVENKNGGIELNSKFIIKLEDYKIKIPSLLWQNIAEQVEVTINFTLQPQ